MAKFKKPKYLSIKGFLQFLILHELRKKQLCGDELAEKIGKRKGGKLTPGTIYPALKKLKKYKLIKWRKSGRKKIYFLTPKGKKDLSLTYHFFSNLFYGVKKK